MIRPYANTAYFLMVVPEEALEEGSLHESLGTTDQHQVGLRSWTTQRWGHLSLEIILNFCKAHQPTFKHTLSIFDFNGSQLV